MGAGGRCETAVIARARPCCVMFTERCVYIAQCDEYMERAFSKTDRGLHARAI